MDKYPVVFMKYADNRSSTVPTEIFTGFNGYLQTAEAFVYLNNQFNKLKVYITDGRLNRVKIQRELKVLTSKKGIKKWFFRRIISLT